MKHETFDNGYDVVTYMSKETYLPTPHTTWVNKYINACKILVMANVNAIYDFMYEVYTKAS